MKSRNLRFIILFFLLNVTVIPLFAANDQNLLRVGVCELIFTGSGTDELSSGISNSLYEALSDIVERKIESEEITSILTSKMLDKLSSKKIELEKLYSERDLLLFSSSLRDLSSNIQTKNEEIKECELEISEMLIEIEETGGGVGGDDFSILPIEIAHPDDGSFFQMKAGDPSYTAAAWNLDLLVYGFIEELEDYYLIEFIVWNNITGREIGEWKTAVKYNDLHKELLSGINMIRTAILGREWAGLTVESSGNSLIYVDDVFYGIGRFESRLFIPGAHLVSVKRPGFKSIEKEVFLNQYETAYLNINPEAEVDRMIIFQSYPQGADLYIDSQWMGKTPFRADIKSFPAAVRISKDEWEDREFFLDRYSENLVDINLKPEFSDRSDWVDANRARFYGSLGAFILSIPLTAMCYGGIEQTALAYNSEYIANGTTNIDELSRLEALNKGIYAAYLGSLGLNIILFFDTIMQAVDYVDSVDYGSN